jgi:hypothetical protein
LADGQICTKVKDYTTTPCKDVLIDPECKINADGECTIITLSKNNKCQYVNRFNKCQFYEIDTECKIEDNTCKNKGDPPKGQKCYFVDQSRTKCKLRDIRCADFNQDQCDGENEINSQSGRKCSWNGICCKEYKIDNVCTVTSTDQCGKKADATLQENYKCLFTNSSKLECIQKLDTCESYYTDCSSHNIENQIQCINNSPNCKKIEIDENCEVIKYLIVGCYKKDGKTIDTQKKCDFWNEEKTICKIMDKHCNEFYDENDCHTVDNCAYIAPYTWSFSYCFLTETKDNSVCKINDNRECIPAKENSIANYETCDFIYENKKAICQKRNLDCNEIKDQNICNSVKTDEQQCLYLGTSCLELINDDDYCYYNTNEGKCTLRSGYQPSNYYCTTITNNKVCSCFGGEIKCSSIKKTDECNSFTPVDRQCFYVQDHDDNYECKDIKVDSQCKINEEGKCTGNGCEYDDDDEKNHCAYKNNDSAILKIKRLLLLALFFIF